MFTEDQLKTIRESLPYDGTKQIKAKLFRTSARVIAKELNDPNTKRTDIVNAAVEVAAAFKVECEGISGKIQELAS